jgi:hypothetical protein
MLSNPTIGRASLGFRVEEDNDSPALCRGSLGFWTDQGADVEGLVIYLTPDLGWVSQARMQDPVANSRLINVLLSSAVTTSTSPTRIKGPDNLIFEYDGLYIKFPRSLTDSLGTGKHLFWVDDSGITTEVDWFTFTRDQLPIEEEPGDAQRERPWLY